MRYIRYKREKQQINLLNCNELDKWVDTCHYRPTEFYDVCEDCCSGGTSEPSYEWVLDSTVCGSELGSEYLSDHLYEKWIKYDKYDNSIISVDYRNGVPSKECGYVLDKLAFEFTGDSVEYKINGKGYTATTSPYSTTLSELGVTGWTSASSMFYGESNLTKVTSIPDTSNVINMASMFGVCNSLKSINLSNFDTSNAISMQSMFSGCSGLTSLDVSNFNTSKVTSMASMFSSCSGLTSLDLSNFNTSKVTKMGGMFDTCMSLTSLDLSSFNTSNVTDMHSMFSWCTDLTSLDLSHFDTSNVTNMSSMFYMWRGALELDLSNFNTSNVTNMDLMFYQCMDLEILNISNWNTSKVTNMESMFDGCPNLRTIYMCNCSEDTIADIETALTDAGIRDQVTIITT